MPNFMKIRPVWAELFHTDRRTDWGADGDTTKPSAALSKFCERA